MRDYKVRRVTSPTWDPPPLGKHALSCKRRGCVMTRKRPQKELKNLRLFWKKKIERKEIITFQSTSEQLGEYAVWCELNKNTSKKLFWYFSGWARHQNIAINENKINFEFKNKSRGRVYMKLNEI